MENVWKLNYASTHLYFDKLALEALSTAATVLDRLYIKWPKYFRSKSFFKNKNEKKIKNKNAQFCYLLA